MGLIDSHCHIHDDEYSLPVDEVIQRAVKADVESMICVGTTLADSNQAITLAKKYDFIHASVGLHPHHSNDYTSFLKQAEDLCKQKEVVAIGECGLDFYYNDKNTASKQHEILRQQIELGLRHEKALIFHVRGSKNDPTDCFDDFFSILDDYKIERAVVHSFSAQINQLEQIIKRGMYVGVNGIATFTKNRQQIEAFKAIPIESMVLETDTPYLTPAPVRGTINEPSYISYVASFMASLSGVDIDVLVEQTSRNAKRLFQI